MNRVVHFEIAADDPERAAQFYQKVFGWEIKKWDGPIPYWLVMTGPEKQLGIDGGIFKREKPLTGSEDPEALTTYRCTIDVSDLDAFIGKVEKAGGSTTTPKMAVPGVGWMAFAKDTEANTFGMMQTDTNAK